MATEIRVPEMGESLVEATVGQWLKEEGDTVVEGEPIVELETDKVNLSVSAEEGGVLQRRTREVGDVVRAGEVLGEIGIAGGGTAGGDPSRDGATGAAGDDAASTSADRGGAGTPEAAPPSGVRPDAPGPAGTQGRAPARTVAEPPAGAEEGSPRVAFAAAVRATPLARRKAEAYRLDLGSIEGSGVAGRIRDEDVERAQLARGSEQGTQAREENGPAVARPLEQRHRLSARRRTIARRLLEAHQSSVMTTTFNDVDMAPVMELRRRRRENFRARTGTDLGLMPFFVRAVVAGLRAFPQLNAELDGDDLILKSHYDIGIAVDAEEGLVVPVLRNADQRGFSDIQRSIEDMVARTRERRLTLEELTGGTFTITNGGVFGSLMSTPLLNPPQVGILGMHRIAERPVVVDGQVVARPMMYLALTYDHRVVDGATAVRFLVRVKELVEDPELLLLEG